MRRHIDGLDSFAPRSGGQDVDVETASVDGDGDEAGARAREGRPRRGIADALHGDRAAVAGDGARHQSERHLTAARDQDLLGGRGYAADLPHEVRDRGAQTAVAPRVAIAEGVARAAPGERPAKSARDEVDGQETDVGHSARHDERSRRRRHRKRGGSARREREVGDAGHRLGTERTRWSARAGFGDRLRHVGAAPRTHRRPALGGELPVGGDDRVAVDTQRAGEDPRTGERLAGAEPAASDVVGDAARDAQEHGTGPGLEGQYRSRASSHRTSSIVQTGPCG